MPSKSHPQEQIHFRSKDLWYDQHIIARPCPLEYSNLITGSSIFYSSSKATLRDISLRLPRLNLPSLFNSVSSPQKSTNPPKLFVLWQVFGHHPRFQHNRIFALSQRWHFRTPRGLQPRLRPMLLMWKFQFATERANDLTSRRSS